MKIERRFLFQFSVLSVSHLFNDMYSNFIPQMLPFLVVVFSGFTATRATLLVSAFSVTSSLVQPLFGLFLDRQGKRWLVYIGTLWMSIMLGIMGLVPSYPILLILAVLAGLGTAAFHPMASTMVNMMSGNRKAVLLSVFVSFGNFGTALSPLLLVKLFQTFGLNASIFMVIPGIFVTILLLLFAPRSAVSSGPKAPFTELLVTLKASSRELGAILGVIAVRSIAYTSMISLLPLYFKSQNIGDLSASRLVFIMLCAGAIGGVLGGFISDMIGRKRLIVGSLVLSTPLFFGFFLLSGPLSTVFLALAGAALLSNMSVCIVAAQEVIPNNKALASGLTMGFAGGVGSLIAISFGRLADTLGFNTALSLIFVLPLAAGLIGMLMKNNLSDRRQRLAQKQNS